MPSSIAYLKPEVSFLLVADQEWLQATLSHGICQPSIHSSPSCTHILPPSGPTEISDGMEVSDELSVCSDNSYDTYANSTTSPMGPQGSGSRATTLTDRSGR